MYLAVGADRVTNEYLKMARYASSYLYGYQWRLAAAAAAFTALMTLVTCDCLQHTGMQHMITLEVDCMTIQC
jgi:hypothetical protein